MILRLNSSGVGASSSGIGHVSACSRPMLPEDEPTSKCPQCVEIRHWRNRPTVRLDCQLAVLPVLAALLAKLARAPQFVCHYTRLAALRIVRWRRFVWPRPSNSPRVTGSTQPLGGTERAVQRLPHLRCLRAPPGDAVPNSQTSVQSNVRRRAALRRLRNSRSSMRTPRATTQCTSDAGQARLRDARADPRR